jgi:outer membrane murein-binding lipoprotein Lpp
MSDTLIGAAISGFVALAGYWLVFKVNRRTATTDAAQKQIDQIQEDRSADREQFEKAASRFEERQVRLERRQEQLEAANRISNDYVYVLRAHISEGRPPPPPPFPPEMTRGMANDR